MSCIQLTRPAGRMTRQYIREIKWSLSPEKARAVFHVLGGNTTFTGRVCDLNWALTHKREFRASASFAGFLAVNGIELIGGAA